MGVVGRTGFDAKNFISLLNQKKTFLLAVCANFIVQLGITYWTMMNYPARKMGVGLFWFYIILQFIIIFVLMSRSVGPVVKFLLFITDCP